MKTGEINNLLEDIEIMRSKLECLINEKQGNLIDNEVVSASKVLNTTLNKYNKIIENEFVNEA
ncbi:MAG TPA: aspartyl-phosphate phosphatase Spo0E family protein [Clostridiaceae bacterium]